MKYGYGRISTSKVGGAVRRVVEEEPIILVQNGKLLEYSMRKTRINLDGLMS